MPAQGLFGLSGAYSGLWAGVGLSTALSVGGRLSPFVSSAAKQACCYFDLAFSFALVPVITGSEVRFEPGGVPLAGYRGERSEPNLFLKHFTT